MPKKIEKVVIVGGGSAGWMSAATLINFFPNKQIVVIESPTVPTVGVGESTLGGIRHWMHALGIDETDFMKHTNASYKMSIKFTDFYNKDAGSFHYPFGEPQLYNTNHGLAEWQAKKALYPDTPVDDYCRTYYSTMPLIENNKFSTNLNGEFDSFRPDLDVAYHFEAALFGNWLKDQYCIPRGVSLISDTVMQVNTSDDGVDSLTLSDGSIILADLFVDCTGWKSLLLGESLNEPFTPYDDILPNNRAWAVQVPYTDKEKELEPYTNCTAIGNGWVWNIPLWSRLGTGYVYSDKFISPTDALQEFKDYLNSDKMTVHNSHRADDLTFADITMRVGIHKRTWVKNVVAIGLSAGFIEPLESNGLFTVHEFLLSLVAILQREYINQWDRDTYNTATLDIFNNLAEFVSLHYALSVRDDTQYWSEISKKTFSPGMVDRIPSLAKGFNDLVNKKMFDFNHNTLGGIHCIATGMNFLVMSKINLMHATNVFHIDVKHEVDTFVSNRAQLQLKWKNAANDAPSLHTYLSEMVYND